jgi:metacaspase-1
MKKALLVGINYIGAENELRGCINDVNNMNNFLLSIGYTQKNIIRLTDKTVTKPTKKNIIDNLVKLINNAVAGDELFFLYSGHGTIVVDVSRDEVETRSDSAICPLDYSVNGVIVDDDIRSLLLPLKKNVKLTIVLDSCNSGTCCDLKYNYRDLSYNRPKADMINYNSSQWVAKQALLLNNNYTDCTGDIYSISGSSDTQTSADTVINGKPSGALTGTLLNIFKSYNNILTWETLLKDLNCILKTTGYTQRPRLSSGKKLNLKVNVF